ncbi:LOW QUALITY PROTEIN: hypothetical protein U9M48_009224 [Paspalum notatum var. saurae]|uniref:Reverse transcriptase domain-containing protein n=1 Tax=Paspalum notatum var. saurae TaxID=547442 RepID=A0AAQ3SR55_PASNO
MIRGPRQGDPLSPILFNIVADILAIILAHAKDEGQIKGLIAFDGGLSILQYADDTVIFMDHDLEEAMNMKILMCAFEQLSAKEVESFYSHLFGCKAFQCTIVEEERFENRLGSCKGKLLSVGGGAVPRGVLKKLDYYRSRFFSQNDQHKKKLDYYRSCFFSQNDQHKKKYRFARWEILANENGLWQSLLRNEYLIRNKTLTQVEKKLGDSQFWSGLMGIKDQFLNLGSFIFKNGIQIRRDILKVLIPLTFNFVRKKHATVAEVLDSSPLNVSFKRSLVGNKLRDWENLVARLLNVSLEKENDVLKWQLHKSRIFSVRSMYFLEERIGFDYGLSCSEVKNLSLFRKAGSACKNDDLYYVQKKRTMTSEYQHTQPPWSSKLETSSLTK